VNRRALLLAIGAVALLGCATGAPTKATAPEQFFGAWTGSWQNQTNSSFSGHIDVEIVQDAEKAPGNARLTASLTGARTPWFAATGALRDGALLLVAPGATTIELVLHGQDRIEAKYFNDRDRGVWSLKRKGR
jgi:hypothetical protein